MNIEDLARECMDVETDRRCRVTFSADSYGLARFAALVRAAALDEAAALIDGTWLASPGEYSEAIRKLAASSDGPKFCQICRKPVTTFCAENRRDCQAFCFLSALKDKP